MSQIRKPLSVLLGAAVATGTLATGSLFSMDALAHGYMQDAARAGSGKAAEGKCGGEGKCGAGKMAVAKASHEGGCGMAKMDTDKDGRISRTEFTAAHPDRTAMFAEIDRDGDGFISQAEMDAHHAAMQKDAKPAAKAASEGKCGEGKCGEGKCGSM
ncbi:EF-hand domain-containing protein [Thermomonas sp. S9]|uniref:HvfA family oxazolone/thioamide-modified RiPP metallophore n=1 Tax=Thermomonas sp. S9 TaxID=2885203 RepID=UPI00216B1F96|nr:EF-hand domain-containing protein [Thermomonas sp. S9]MCR6497002.1 EF-hand domain-containing protein [Thermomonas sp. S9]